MLIGILGGRVPNEVENFDGDLLRHGLNAVIKLGLANSHCLELKLRLALYKPCLDVVRPERGAASL